MWDRNNFYSSSNDLSGYSADEEQLSWLDWFWSIEGNEFFVVVEEDYIRDCFNLIGLNSLITNFKVALSTILDEFEEYYTEEEDTKAQSKEAMILYGLIHARYIRTPKGLVAMLQKYLNDVFGFCPNTMCSNQRVLPIGLSDELKVSSTKIFCPHCNEIYNPSNPNLVSIDGCYFGTTFPHLFFLSWEKLVLPNPTDYFISTIYGFRVSKTVKDNLRKLKKIGEKKKNSSYLYPVNVSFE